MTVENTYVASLPMLLTELEVVRAERVSPSFVRIELGGPELAEFGTPGPVLDQRIKIVFPNAAGTLPSFADADESWWTTWMEIPEDERGSMRTYTIRDVVGEGADTRFVVDIVVHEASGHDDPLDGAGNRWALQAAAGQRLVVMAPRRGHEFGGIEWSPGAADRLLLVGDETAAPAIRGILRDLPADASGAAFLEVPVDGDVLDDVVAPPGVEVTWLPRNGGARGEELHAAVLAHLTGSAPAEAITVGDDEIDPDLWETPVYSSSGEQVADATAVPTDGSPFAGLYAWIAGESKVVTGLRRKLVNDLGLDRKQVAFMGYWREGVSMRS
ncbi:NADPH-dependent ferric siderophore reductase [Nocardioides aromaticivorans]|uniref:NADPH-dependent ferric siderophore reductase n=1 Tax=Nocardioides aromaticivorans TaxID=200618 RepID=A0A7Z0CKL8_9ACTN|nr:siderophore-interacting protein [Nocardioides aromaticivorans]NYI44279.1 NADPH-dependent ferric siderophore reductase [Nocardioides aromaticivorans]